MHIMSIVVTFPKPHRLYHPLNFSKLVPNRQSQILIHLNPAIFDNFGPTFGNDAPILHMHMWSILVNFQLLLLSI